jgi:hypothetical protein
VTQHRSRENSREFDTGNEIQSVVHAFGPLEHLTVANALGPVGEVNHRLVELQHAAASEAAHVLANVVSQTHLGRRQQTVRPQINVNHNFSSRQRARKRNALTTPTAPLSMTAVAA